MCVSKRIVFCMPYISVLLCEYFFNIHCVQEPFLKGPGTVTVCLVLVVCVLRSSHIVISGDRISLKVTCITYTVDPIIKH